MIKRYIYDHDGHIKMNTWILKHDFFFWLSNEHACGNFFFTRHVYPTEKLLNDVKMQLKEQIACCYLKK